MQRPVKLSKRRHSSSLAFNDILFNVLLGFVMLFIIAFLLINPITKKNDIPAKAEVMIVLEWEDTSSVDIDLWVQRDDTAMVGFSNKQNAPLHLDRDDLGARNDTVEINGNIEVIYLNRETTTIRGIVAGDYFISTHTYGAHSVDKKPIEITVTVMDVNPYREIYSRKVFTTRRGQIINFPGFTLDAEGKITDVFDHRKNLGPQSTRSNTVYPDAAVREAQRNSNNP